MKLNVILSLTCFTILTTLSSAAAALSLTAGEPVELTGTQGRFDFIKIDSMHNRLLACHTGNGSLDVIDLSSSKLVKSIPTGAVQGIAIDNKSGRYFASVSKPPKLVIIDSTKLAVIGEVLLPGPADLVAYHTESNRVFVCNDEKPELWIIDPEAKNIVKTLVLPGGGMEDLGLDAQGKYLFQCLKDTSELAKIDPKNGKLFARWSTLPAEKPHGLAMVGGTDSVLVVGSTGKLILLSLTTGQVLASTDVSPKVDEIAYDPTLQRVYCASGLGTISVVGVDRNKLTTLSPLISAAGAHSVAVDPQTHTVWIVFAKDGKSYVQSFNGNSTQ